MTKQPSRLPTADAAARASSEELSRCGNRLLLLEALLLTILMCSLYAVLDGVFSVLSSLLPNTWLWALLLPLGRGCAMLLLSLFVLLPLLLGLFHMAYRMSCRQETVLAELFHSFSSPKAYGRALGLSFGFAWRMLLLLSVVCGTYSLADALRLPLPAVVGVSLLLVAEGVIGILLLSRSFYTLALSMREPTLSLTQCRRASRRMYRVFPRRGVGFLLYFLPQLLLGLLTFGILLLMHTLPKMLIAYFRFCQGGTLSDFIERENIS